MAPALRLESGVPTAADHLPERVALLVHWSDQSQVSLSVCRLVDELRHREYDVIVVSAAEVEGNLLWRSEYQHPTAVYRRPNIGYDFGSWAAGLAAFPDIRRAEHVLMLNDSLLGPFAPLDLIIDDFESAHADVWALVDSTQRGLHVQSHFVGYRGGCLARPPLAEFWRDIRVERTKQDIIDNYEIGLGALIRRSGLLVRVCFPWSAVVADGDNPTIQGWRRLLLKGFPFVKREALLRPHEVLQDAEDIGPVVRELFGQDVWEWV